MDVSGINSSPLTDPFGLADGSAMATPGGGGGGVFEAMLRTQGGADMTRPFAARRLAAQNRREGNDTATAKDAANQLIATTFLRPLLAQLRHDPFRTPLFHGGQGEDAFGAQLDTRIADALAKRMNLPLADKIVKQIVRHQQAAHHNANATGGQVNVHG